MRLLDDFHQRLGQLVAEQVHSQVPLIGEIVDHLLGGGKRLRARFTWLTGMLFSQQQDEALLKLACAIEFIHLATLMHDDVVDQSLLRRGRQAVHTRWGASEAVLVGDFIYSRAFEILVTLGSHRVLELTASSTNLLAEGEVEQLVYSRSAEYSPQEYYRVIEKKTGALFGCASACAATLGGADTATSNQLYQLGMDVGVAFQIVDDVIDYTATQEGMGKQPGDDFREGKFTLPLILCARAANPAQRRLIDELLASRDQAAFVRMGQLMRQLGVPDEARRIVARRIRPALELMEALPDSQPRQLLLDEIAALQLRQA